MQSYSDVGMCQAMREGRTHWLPMALAEGRERGYSAFQLWTHADNSRAQRLYEGLQFVRPAGRMDDVSGERIVHYTPAKRSPKQWAGRCRRGTLGHTAVRSGVRS